MRVLRTGILVVVLLAISTHTASAAVKNGSPCKSVGKSVLVNGKTLICQKSAGKKTYRTVEVKSSGKDAYSGLSGNISLTAYTSLAAYLQKQPVISSSSVFMELSPNASYPLSQSTLLDTQNGSRFWQEYTPSTTKIHIVFANRTDLAWFEAKMKQIQPGETAWLPRILDLASSNNQAAYAGANGRDAEGNALFFYLPGTNTQSDSAGWQGVGPHEWTHFAQNTIAGDIRKAPCWFKEGQATYYGNAISNKAKSTWASIWKRQIQGLKYDYPAFYSFTESQMLEWFKAHELNMPNDVCGPDGAFTIGGIATEYLVGTIGIEGVNNFKLLIGKGQEWKEALRQVTGISYEDEMQKIIKFVMQQRSWSELK